MRFWDSWIDPSKLLMYREKQLSGCRVCKRSIWKRGKYVCKMGIAGHPNNDETNCQMFKTKK